MKDIKVTTYKNEPYYKAGKLVNNFVFNGEDTFTGFIANCIDGGWLAETFGKIRTEPDEKEQKALKTNKLPGYTISTYYNPGKRKRENVNTYNHLIVIDIDNKENLHIKDWPALRDYLFNMPEVLVSALSARGNGCFIIVQLDEKSTLDNHSKYYEALKRAFLAIGLKTDDQCSDFARMRFLTCDPGLKYRHEAKAFVLPPEPPKKPQKAPKYKHKQNGHYDPFTHAVNAANKRWGQFSDGIKHSWINTATWVMKQNNVPQNERENFITNNYLDKSEINTNCLQ